MDTLELKQYHEKGYHVERGLLSQKEIDALFASLRSVIRRETVDSDRIFLQEEPALKDAQADVPPEGRIYRKIEGLVRWNEDYNNLASHPRILGIIESVAGPDIKVFRDALMMKPPRHGSPKPWHQDSAYWLIEPMDLISVWIALDDATAENGCMRVIPGSHREGLIEHKQLFDFQVEDSQIDLSREVPVEMKAGDGLFFHSLLLHATSPNTSDKSRRAMIVSYMSARSKWTGDPAKKPEFILVQGQAYPGCV